MLKKHVLLAFFAFLFLIACNSEPPIEKERRMMNELVHNKEVVLYKGLKICLRAIPIKDLQEVGTVPNSQWIKRFDNDPGRKPAAYTYLLAATLFQTYVNEKKMDLTLEEYAIVAKEIFDIREQIIGADEDVYPTILTNVMQLNQQQKDDIFKFYNKDFEHLLLATLFSVNRYLPFSVTTYELSRLDGSKIKQPEIKMFVYLLKSINCYLQKWFWLTEESSSNYIQTLDQESMEIQTFLAKNKASVPQEAKVTYAQLHSLGLLLRAAARLEIEKEDEALDDMEAFLKDAETMGLDNEAVDFIGAYVMIKREKYEKAEFYLLKLQKRPALSEEEKVLVNTALEYVQEKESENAIEALADPGIKAKIAIAYLGHIFKQINWQESLANNEGGKKFLKLCDGLEGGYNGIVNQVDAEAWLEEGKALEEEAENKVKSWFN